MQEQRKKKDSRVKKGDHPCSPLLNINVSKEIMMSDNTTPQEDDNTERGTVSIRNMEMELWYKASFMCKMRKERLPDYIGRLIAEDSKAYEDARNEE